MVRQQVAKRPHPFGTVESGEYDRRRRRGPFDENNAQRSVDDSQNNRIYLARRLLRNQGIPGTISNTLAIILWELSILHDARMEIKDLNSFGTVASE